MTNNAFHEIARAVACALALIGSVGAQDSKPKPAPVGAKITVAGRVTDSQSRPIYGAKVYVELKAPDGVWDRIIWDEGDAHTDYNGNFQISRPLQANRDYRVGAEKDLHWLDEPTEFEIGTANVQLILSPAGAIGGSFVLDPSVYAKNITIEVRRELLPHETQEDLTTWHPKEDGTFKLGPLRRGKYGVRVTVDQGREILLDVEPVSVRDGETSEDPRLQKVDLRQRIKGIALTIVDEKDQRVEGARVVVLPSLKTSPISHDIHYSQSARVFMLVRQVPIDVAVVAPGYARVKLTDLASDKKVVMKPGIPVRVTLQGGARIPEAPIYLQASLELESDMKDQDAEARRALGMEQGVDPIAFGPDGVAQLWAPAPGRYVVILSIARKINRITTAAAVPHKAAGVNVGSSPAELTIDVSPVAIERALAQVGVR